MTAQQTHSRNHSPRDDRADASATQCFLIVGVARSGTSFLQRILDRHDDVRLSYEGHLLTEGWECYQRHNDLSDRTQFEALLDELVDCDKGQPRNHWLADGINANRDVLWEFHGESPGFANLIEKIYQLPGAVRCWGNKILRSEHCQRILEHFPEARFAVLTRDPRAVYASQRRYFPGMSLAYSAMYSNQHLKWADEVARYDDRFYVVRYEDFVREPRSSLTTMFSNMRVEPEHVVNQIMQDDPPHADSLEKWRDHLSENQIRRLEEYCHDRMIKAGYKTEFATEQRRLSVPVRAGASLREFFRILPLRPSVWRRKRLWQRFLNSLGD